MPKKNLKIPKISAKRSLVLVVSILFGLLIAAQFRSLPLRVSNPIAPYLSLRETRDELLDEQSHLKEEILELQQEIKEFEKDYDSLSLTENELKMLTSKKATAGLTKLNGRGVIITLDDSKISAVSEDTIIHAADLRDLINSLWSAGAEGIAINGQRVVVSSAVDCIVNTIMINNTKLSNPFQVEAVGDQDLLFDRIGNPETLPALYGRKEKNGIIFDLSKNNDITLPVYSGSFETKVTTSEENV